MSSEHTCDYCSRPLKVVRSEVQPCDCGQNSFRQVTPISLPILLVVISLAGALVTWFLPNFRQLFPDNAAADRHAALAKDLIMSGDNKAGISEFQKAIDLSPNRPDLRFDLAQVFFQLEQPHQGLEQAKEAARLNPTDFEIQEVYAEALQQYGKELDALPQFDLVVKRFPNEVVCRQQAALANDRAGNEARAVQLWKEALKLDPSVPSGWSMLAKLVYRTGQPPEVESIIRQGLEHNRDSPKLHFWHGLILNKLKKTEEATQEFRTAARLDEDYFELVEPYLESPVASKTDAISVVPIQVDYQGTYAKARLNDTASAKLLIDSGATSCLINSALARKLGIDLQSAQSVQIGSVTGTDVGKIVNIQTLKVGNMSATNVKCLVYDKSVSNADGILGMSFLSKFKFTIDADVRQLILVSKKN